jgi:hypothetical protein
MSDKTDAAFLLALLILTIIGLVASSAAHSFDAPLPRASCSLETAFNTQI